MYEVADVATLNSGRSCKSAYQERECKCGALRMASDVLFAFFEERRALCGA